MKNVWIIALIFICAATWLNAQVYCVPRFVMTELDQTLIELEDFYRDHFGPPEFPPVEEAMAEIENFIIEVSDNIEFSSSCDAGSLEATGSVIHTESEEMMFRWEFDLGEEVDYNAYVLNLRDLLYTTQPYNGPGARLVFEPQRRGQLMAINVRCPQSRQSSFYIIIIDRDIGIADINDACEAKLETVSGPGVMEEQPRLSNTEMVLTSHPNPGRAENAFVALHLPTAQSLSIHIHSASGHRLYSILDRQWMEPGEYQWPVPVEVFSAGMYYLVLESAGQRIVQKLIRL